MLARVRHGLAEAAMLANGFAADLLAGLVPAELAISAGGPTIKSERFTITDAGLRAVAEPGLEPVWVRVILPQPGESSRYPSWFSVVSMNHRQWLIGRRWLRGRMVLPPPRGKGAIHAGFLTLGLQYTAVTSPRIRLRVTNGEPGARVVAKTLRAQKPSPQQLLGALRDGCFGMIESGGHKTPWRARTTRMLWKGR